VFNLGYYRGLFSSAIIQQGQLASAVVLSFDFKAEGCVTAAAFAAARVCANTPIKPEPSGSSYLTKLRYEASASISSGPSVLATIGIGDSGAE
jgi:hypothetical protein